MKKLRLFLLALMASIVVLFVVDVASVSAAGCAYTDRGYCVPGQIASDTWWTPAPKHSYGKAVWYAPYLMNATAEWRGMSLEGFEGGVAMMSPADIGQVVWLKRPGEVEGNSAGGAGVWEGPFLVVDVSSRVHMWTTITQIGEIIEVDFQTALRWGMVEGNQNKYSINDYMIRDVEVYKGLHPPFETSAAVDYVEWYEGIVAWGNGTYRRWSTDDIEVANYPQYRGNLASYLQIDLTILYTGERREETASTDKTIVPSSSLSVGDAHHYTQAYMETVQTVSAVTWELDCEDDNPYNGFTFIDYCVPGVISRDAWLMAYPKHTVGVATYYAPGVMDRVVANRGMSLKGYVDGIVTMTCGNIGDSAWVRRPGHGWEGPYLVVDCGGPHGVWAFTQYGLHVEVDYDRWALWRDDGGGTQNVEVCMGSNSCGSSSPVSWWKYWLVRQEWLLPIVDDVGAIGVDA